MNDIYQPTLLEEGFQFNTAFPSFICIVDWDKFTNAQGKAVRQRLINFGFELLSGNNIELWYLPSFMETDGKLRKELKEYEPNVRKDEQRTMFIINYLKRHFDQVIIKVAQ